jgi:hypothetical protein
MREYGRPIFIKGGFDGYEFIDITCDYCGDTIVHGYHGGDNDYCEYCIKKINKCKGCGGTGGFENSCERCEGEGYNYEGFIRF